MSGMHKIVPSLVLFFFALALSACAIQSEVVAPAPVPAAAEPAVTTAPPPAVEQAAPAPSVMAGTPAPKPVVKKVGKHRKIVAKVVPPKVMAPAPLAIPVPAVQPEAPAAAPPQVAPAPIAMSAPVQPAEEKGFLENYWVWLLGIVIAAAALLWFLMGKKKE
ncbi:MAG: hypothetical protein ABI144_06510 [Gallionella sp.]